MRCEATGLETPEAAARWRTWLHGLAAQGAALAMDPCFGDGYHRAHALHAGAEARCVRVTDGARALVVPYLRVAVGGGVFDAQSAHGYGGPVGTSTDVAFLRDAWDAVRARLARESVVACFLRLHPLGDNARWVDPRAALRDDRPTASVEVARGAAGPALANHRNMLSRAARLGLSAEVSAPSRDDLDAFAALYDRTMDRLDAAPAYRFGPRYLRALADGLGPALSLGRVRDARGDVVAAALALWGPAWGDYHLAARDPEGDNCAGNLLLEALTAEARARGLRALHLGGGRTPAPDDALWRFKSRVGTGRHAFRTAGIVVEPPRYDDLVARWTAGPGRGAAPTWFLGWRQPPREATRAG